MQVADGDVFNDCSGKQFDLLRYGTDTAAQAPVVDLGDVVIADPYLPGLYRIDMLQQRNQCSLAGTAGADDGCRLSFLDGQIQRFENLLARTIPEGNVFERDVADHVRFKGADTNVINASFQE